MAAVFVLLTCLLGACGGTHASTGTTRSSPPSTAVYADTWKPPVVPGPPSTEKFCTLLVAQYQHIKTNTAAVSLKVRQQIVRDYVDFTATVIGAAPPDLAPVAKVYLQGIAQVLSDLNAVGLDPSKAPPGQIGAILVNPQVEAAGTQVLAFSQQNCHYDIAGVA